MSTAPAAGSSPLTRGARHGTERVRQLRRLIPAHAGSTFFLGDGKVDLTAHPRSRGEHFDDSAMASIAFGSSPLTRGARSRERLRGRS